MNCLEISEHLSAWLDGELEPELVAAVEAHLAACETCRNELAALRRLTETVRALPRESAPPDIHSEVVGYIERDMLLRRDEPARGAAPWRKTLGAVALAAAGVIIALGAYLLFTHEETTPGPTEYTVAKGETPGQTDDLGAVAEGDREGDRLRKSMQGDGFERDRAAAAHAFDAEPSPAPEPESARKKGTAGETGVAFETKLPGTKPEPSAPTMLAERDKEGEFEKKADTQLGAKTAGTGAPAAMGDVARLDAADQQNAPKPGTTPAATPTPPAPEILDLVVTARNFEATRTQLVACAAELDIRPVERGRMYGAARDLTVESAADGVESRARRGATDVQSGAGGAGARVADVNVTVKPAPAGTDEKTRAMRTEAAAPTWTLEQPTAEALKDQKQLKEAEAKVTPDFAGPEHLLRADALRRPAPALVFAVPREKFPQFVAKLAAEGVRVQIAPPAEIEKLTTRGLGRSDWRTATAPAGPAPPAPAKTGAERDAGAIPREEAKVDEPAKRPAAAEPQVNGEAAELRDEDGKVTRAEFRKAEETGKGAETGEGYAVGRRALGADPNMVYVQIYFAPVEAPAPPETPVPADKPDTEKKPDASPPAAQPADR